VEPDPGNQPAASDPLILIALFCPLAGLLPARRGPPANGIPTEEELAAEKSRILSG
jgi:hypothetical protein